MTQKMKTNKIIAVLTLAVLTLPVLAIAANVPAAPGQVSGDIGSLVSKLLDKIWIVFAGIAIVLFLWAGVLFLTAQGNPEKIAQARMAFLWGVVGVVVMILAFSIFSIATSLIQ